MAVLLTKKARVLVQGITGHQGTFHTRAMLDFGTKVVAGVTPGKGGTKVEGVPVFDGVREAVLRRKANASIIFVPAPFAKDAAIEAIEAGLKLVVVITERIPFHDCLDLVPYARSKGCAIIGPNCPGIITPGQSKMGIMPNHIFAPGDV
ncbi:MAG TPA: CoA-binding protein, partial [Thermoplasmata archaeon]